MEVAVIKFTTIQRGGKKIIGKSLVVDIVTCPGSCRNIEFHSVVALSRDRVGERVCSRPSIWIVNRPGVYVGVKFYQYYCHRQ